jgi:hypothetical protein
MFCLVRRNAPGSARHAGEITRRAQETLAPMMLRELRGFLGFCGLVGGRDDRIASASLYRDRRSALAAAGFIRAWVEAHARGLLPEPPEVYLGECFAHRLAKPQDSLPTLHCAVAAWRVPAGDRGARADAVRGRVLPGLARADAFRGFYAFFDEATGQLVAVSVSERPHPPAERPGPPRARGLRHRGRGRARGAGLGRPRAGGVVTAGRGHRPPGTRERRPGVPPTGARA